jgi:hypothetical protein
MNEMARKLRDAGYSSSFEKLIQIAEDAWSRSPGKASALARHRYVQDRLSGELTYEMMRQWEPDALRRSINYLLASTEPKDGDSVVGFLPTGGGQQSFDTQDARAPATSSPDPAQAGGGGHLDNDTQRDVAPANNDATPPAERRSEPASSSVTPRTSLPAAPSLSALADKMAKRTRENGLTMIRLSKLDEVKVLVNGVEKPLRVCTAGEVRAWASWTKKQRMHAQFAERLVSNLNSNEIVGDKWKGDEEEIEKLYAETEAEDAA